MKLSYVVLFSGMALLGACKNKESGSSKSAGTTDDVVSSHIDTTVHPGDDFFGYANGGWLKNNPIPQSESGWGIFNLVADENYAQIKKISEDASAAKSAKGTPQQQIGDFFYCGMDSASVEKNGISPLNELLAKIEAIKSKSDLVNMLTELQLCGVNPAYSIGVGQDMKLSDQNSVYLSQGGLGMPDRDYYFNMDTRTQHIRAEYLTHITTMLTLVDKDSIKAKTQSNNVLKLETSLASAHKKLEDLRDPYANYHKMSIVQVNALTSAINWKEAFAKMNIKSDSVIVGQPAFYTKLNALINSEPVDNWKAYLRWQLVSSYAPYLSSAFDKANFNFYYKTLNGSKEQRPRWKRVLDAQENAIGEALGQLFVNCYQLSRTYSET